MIQLSHLDSLKGEPLPRDRGGPAVTAAGVSGSRVWGQSGGRATVWIRDARERPLRSIVKAITWRTTGSLDTFVLSFLFTRSVQVSAAISLSEIVTKFVLYYVHERLWARSRFGYRTEQKSRA